MIEAPVDRTHPLILCFAVSSKPPRPAYATAASMTTKIGLLVSDFDDTLTASDTINVVFGTAVDAIRQQQGIAQHFMVPVPTNLL